MVWFRITGRLLGNVVVWGLLPDAMKAVKMGIENSVDLYFSDIYKFQVLWPK